MWQKSELVLATYITSAKLLKSTVQLSVLMYIFCLYFIYEAQLIRLGN